MSAIRSLLSLIALLVVVGCSDTVESRYVNRAEAEADSLFERGWLPNIIPQSSHDIVTKNNLDVNTSSGEISFLPTDSADFARHLVGTRDFDKEFSSLTYSNNGTTWFFEVNFSKGHCKYSMIHVRTTTSEQNGAVNPPLTR